MNKRWLAALVAVLAVIALAAFGATAHSSSSQSGGTFKIGTSSRIDSLNPYVAFIQDAYSTFEYVYPLLVQYDKSNSHFAPDFATSWKATNGGKTWTFKTRASAVWSDGKPLTAKDAAWTINTDLKYASGGAANAAGLVTHIHAAPVRGNAGPLRRGRGCVDPGRPAAARPAARRLSVPHALRPRLRPLHGRAATAERAR
jgi:ABC-type transport system substrate-binding protein